MKLNRLLLLGLFPLIIFSCTDKDNDGSNPGDKQEEAYFNLKLAFPASSDARAGEPTTSDEDGDGYQTGLSVEQNFQNVAVVVVSDATNVVTDYVTYTADEFAPDGNSSVDDDNIGTTPTYRMYASKQAKLVTKGDASVYVFLNPTADVASTYAVGNTVDGSPVEMPRLTSSDLTVSLAKDDNFLMGNADTPQVYTIDGTSSNPTIVTVNVERAVAKLVERTTKATFTVENSQNLNSITATFENYDYNFLNKRSYLLKSVQTRNDANAVAGSYVVDPNFISSEYLAYAPAAPYYGNDFFILGNQEISKPFTTASEITYSLENTMISNEQYIDKTTSVVYKASLELDGGTAATFYTYKNRIFTSYSDLRTVYNEDYPASTDALGEVFTEEDVEDAYTSTGNYSNLVQELNIKLLDKGIRCYYNGECYYNWPIKHWDQEDVFLGRMEFGVVRNNVYYLEVTRILSIGEPWVPGGPEDPDPEDPDPDEDEDAYLMVEITVLPWVVRYNNIQF